ncbi:nuclear transport factor 2 family protein [Salinimonas sp. HHU 13199]|uniref:Nuclear transport factor 2 family protein n=2 Tax=Salinimonas profundi TaxID=2729140 RepID=A0ABR8LNV2_9ALTE|nr:nuclear transport factor 2 family protein [Salinimonas profundi]
MVLLLLQIGYAYADDKTQIDNVLNELHDSAANADMNTYFSLYADDAVFIGTDASEIWSLDAFKAYAEPVFSSGKGWTYMPAKRHITVSDSAQTAWFVEMLHSETYGTTRGTGVLVKSDGRWKIAQYHLTIPIPNAIAKDVTSKIKAMEN